MKAERPLRVHIAGCGPAGLSAALFLHRAGHQVRLFDQLEQPRPIGSGLVLQPTGRAVLCALGLEAAALALGHPISRMLGTLANGRVVLDVSYHTGAGAAGDNFGLAIHRGALFGILHRAVEAAGIPVVTGWRIARVEQNAESACLIGVDGQRSSAAELVVDAMGLRSPMSQAGPDVALPYGAFWATLDWVEGQTPRDLLVQRYERSHRMAGVLPLGRERETGREKAAFFWSIRNDAVADWCSAGLSAWKNQVLSFWPEAAPYVTQVNDAAQLTYARYAQHTPRTPINGRVVRIGDSAHCTSPQLGQGANMALLDAAALAYGLARCGDVASALDAYRTARRLHVALYQGVSRIFTPFYQSSSRALPPLRDYIMQPLSQLWPMPHLLGKLVRGEIGDPLGRVGLGQTFGGSDV